MITANILVTGVGSDIGFNCGRILRALGVEGALYGIDIHADHAGAIVFDRCAIAPRASDAGYAAWLRGYVTNNDIHFVLPTSEAEIGIIDRHRLDQKIPAIFLIANGETVRAGLDKHFCLERLAASDIAVPAHGLVGQEEPCTWPVIVKPRSGQGSKDLQVVHSLPAYRALSAEGHVWQERLLPADEEYTCAVYRSSGAGVRILTLRRQLQGGLTGKGEVVADVTINEYVRSIAEALDLKGAMNVQLRRTETGPRLFEINPRLSSTVMIRHLLGFRDLEWWLSELAGCPVSNYDPPATATRFYRGSQEYIMQPA